VQRRNRYTCMLGVDSLNEPFQSLNLHSFDSATSAPNPGHMVTPDVPSLRSKEVEISDSGVQDPSGPLGQPFARFVCVQGVA
jgi:hypothetical protein